MANISWAIDWILSLKPLEYLFLIKKNLNSNSIFFWFHLRFLVINHHSPSFVCKYEGYFFQGILFYLRTVVIWSVYRLSTYQNHFNFELRELFIILWTFFFAPFPSDYQWSTFVKAILTAKLYQSWVIKAMCKEVLILYIVIENLYCVFLFIFAVWNI